MNTQLKEYNHERDFITVRDFLKKELLVNNKPINWGFERWNWSRFHPSMFSEANVAKTLANKNCFDKSIRLCLSDTGEILAMVNIEQPQQKGFAYFQRSEKGNQFLDPLFEYAEENLIDPKSKTIKTDIYDHDIELKEVATRHGWYMNKDCKNHMAEYKITNPPQKKLPVGFEICSMAENGDYDQRCRSIGLGFNHSDPKEWSTPAEYREVQKAPDYRPEFDLYIKTQEGEYVSGCIIWYDDYNKIVTFEPVCTIGEYRRKGLGREVMMEGIRRAIEAGAERAFVGSSQEFYKAIGFEMKYPDHEWIKKL